MEEKEFAKLTPLLKNNLLILYFSLLIMFNCTLFLHLNALKVTAIHKANIMKLGDGLFLNVCKEVAKTYESTGIVFNDMIVDNAAMQVRTSFIACYNLMYLIMT